MPLGGPNAVKHCQNALIYGSLLIYPGFDFLAVRPVVTVQEPTIYAKFGEKVILGCLIEAFPLGIYYWESHRGKQGNSFQRHPRDGNQNLGPCMKRKHLLREAFPKLPHQLLKLCAELPLQNKKRILSILTIQIENIT